jgi:uncharacterized protein YbjQ (UPF0145 family)
MPIYSRPPGQDATWEPRQAAAPVDATAGASQDDVVTSDLSVSEYLLLAEAGYEPLGFVAGSSMHHIGLPAAKWPQNAEIDVLTAAMRTGRDLAMSRMRAQAQQLSADGIVGVQLVIHEYLWGGDVMEFLATGTAVRSRPGQPSQRPPDGEAFTCDLSVQDLYRLRAAGAVPVACVFGTCVYRIAHQSVVQTLRQSGPNTEMPLITRDVWEARELALQRMRAQAAQAGATGIVGVTWVANSFVWGEHATEFFATGTAISSGPQRQAAAPAFTLGLDG